MKYFSILTLKDHLQCKTGFWSLQFLGPRKISSGNTNNIQTVFFVGWLKYQPRKFCVQYHAQIYSANWMIVWKFHIHIQDNIVLKKWRLGSIVLMNIAVRKVCNTNWISPFYRKSKTPEIHLQKVKFVIFSFSNDSKFNITRIF